jgi:hypothetical protein
MSVSYGFEFPKNQSRHLSYLARLNAFAFNGFVNAADFLLSGKKYATRKIYD